MDGKAIRNMVLHVDAPRLDLRGTRAGGTADERDGRAMRADTPFLSATVGKLAMAATAFDLAASGDIDLDTSISTWVDQDTLAGLPLAGGSQALERITVRMLMEKKR